MNKTIRALIILLLPLTSMGALTVNNGGGATNITSTSAWITATIVSTGAANPGLFSYWGTNDGGTNVYSWGHTNVYGVSTQGSYSVQITGLPGFTIHYFRTRGTNTSETNWASHTAQFITLTTPTSAPPSSVRAVTADTNAVLKNPTNFFSANSNLIKSAIGLSGYLTNEPLWIAASNQVQTDLVIAGTNATYATNQVRLLNVATDDLDSRLDVTETNGLLLTGSRKMQGTLDMGGNDITNLGPSSLKFTNGVTITSAKIVGYDTLSTGKVDRVDTNGWTVAAHQAWITNEALWIAASNTVVRTNTIVVNGITYTITNDPGTNIGFVIKLDPSTSNAYCAAAGGASEWASFPASQNPDIGMFNIQNAKSISLTNKYRWDFTNDASSIVSRRDTASHSLAPYTGVAQEYFTIKTNGESEARFVVLAPYDYDVVHEGANLSFTESLVLQRLGADGLKVGIGRAPIVSLDVLGTLWGDNLSGSNLTLSGGTSDLGGGNLTNAGTVTATNGNFAAVRITGGTPTNTSMLMSTNENGQTGWITVRTKIIQTTTQTTNENNLVVTGVGFRPIGASISGALLDKTSFSQGYVDSAGGQVCIRQDGDAGRQFYYGSVASVVRDASLKAHTLTWVSWDTDGATFSQDAEAGIITNDVTYVLFFYR